MAEDTIRRSREELKKANADLTAEIAELKRLSLAFYKGLEERLSESDRQGLKDLRAELSQNASVSPEEMSSKIAEYFSIKLAKEVPVVQDAGRIKALDDAIKAIVPPNIYAEVMAEPDTGKWCGLLKRLYDERFFGPLKKEAEETKRTRILAKESSEEAKRLTERIAGLEKEIENKSAVAKEYLQKAESAAAEAKRLAGEKQLEFNARTAAEGKARDVEKKLNDAEQVSGFAQQLQEQQVLKAQEDARVAEALKASVEEKYAARDADLKQVRAELRQARNFLDRQQQSLDAANSEKDRLYREMTTLSGLEKLQTYHKFFMEQLKIQPFLVGLLLKAAGKVRPDMSDPSKTLDLTENLDWLLLHIVDVLPRVYEWTEKEVKLAGEVDIAKANLMKVVDAVKTYLPENERKILDIRIQNSEQAESAIQAAGKAQGADKNYLEQPEPVGAIVSDMIKFANLQWHLDNEMLVEAVFGLKKSEEYLAIKDPQKRAEWVHGNIENFKVQYEKAAEAMAERKAADALAAKEDAESQRAALNNQLRELELSYKTQMIDLFALLPREIEADAADTILAKMLINEKGPKGDTQDISVENLKSTIELALAQRAEYKQAAKTAEENLKKSHAVLGTMGDELRQKEEYILEIEEAKSNLGKAIDGQTAKLTEFEREKEKILKENEQILTKKEEELAGMNEKVKKLESGEGFKLTDFVSKADYDAKIREKEEEIAVLKKISEGHISSADYKIGVQAKEDEVRGECLPVLTDRNKQISELKGRISELEKILAEKGNASGAIANELGALRQQFETANANAYNPDVHMPKAENAVALAAKEAELRKEYKPAVDRKEELEQKVKEQRDALDGKNTKIIRLERELESVKSEKVEADAIISGTTPYDTSKHMPIEEHDTQIKQKDEQLLAKQGEIDGLTHAKSGIETELAAANANAYNPDVHMLKAENAAALAAKEAEVRKEYKPAVDERDALKQEKSLLEAKVKGQEAAISQEKEPVDTLSAIEAIRGKVPNQADYVHKSDYEKALADAKAASAEEKRIALEQKDAEAKRVAAEKQNKIAELEDIVQGKTAEVEQARKERASLTVFDSTKHIAVEKYAADLAQKDEQLRAKQGAFDALSQSKSGIETELAAAKANVYNPSVHMPKAEYDKLLAEAKAASAEEKRIALEQKENEASQRVTEKQNRVAELERVVNEKAAQIAGAILYDPSKHVKKEDHERIVEEQKATYDAQIAGKQGEITGLNAAKSGLENELGQAKGRADSAEGDKTRLAAELKDAKANVYNPDKHMTKEDYQKALDEAGKKYVAETEPIKARIKELEGQVAAAQQKISECKAESLQQLMNAAEMAARLLKENRELYAKLNPK